MKKKVLSLVTSIALTLTLSAGFVFAKTYTIKDVQPTVDGYQAIQNVLDQKIMNLTAGKFLPNSTVKRGDFARILANINGDLGSISAPSYSSFKDVSTKDTNFKYIEAEKKYIPNFGNSFKPNGYLTREDAAYAIVKAMGYDTDDAAASGVDPEVNVEELCEDANTISKNLQKYVGIAIGSELMDTITQGDKDYFKPKANISRKDLAVLLDNANQKGDFTK